MDHDDDEGIKIGGDDVADADAGADDENEGGGGPQLETMAARTARLERAQMALIDDLVETYDMDNNEVAFDDDVRFAV